MKRILSILAISALAFSACTEKEKFNGGPGSKGDLGSISLNVSPDGAFQEPTKADPAVDVNEFGIAIKDGGGNIVQQWARYADVPEVISLNKGAYTLSASSPGNLPAAFDQPIYAGEQSFSVEPSKLSPIDVTCKLSNMKVEVSYTDEFLKEVTDFSVVVSVSGPESGFLTFTRDVTAPGYFKVAPLTISIQGKRVLDGSEVSQTAYINDVAAQDYHKIRLNAVETGNLQAGIRIDYTTTSKEANITIPGEDEEGGDPDPGPGPEPGVEKPTITGNGIGTPLELTFAEALEAVVDIAVGTPGSTIAELWVEIDSPVLSPEELQNIGIGQKFDLAAVEPGTDMYEALGTELGLIPTDGTLIKTLSSYSFSVGRFMPILFNLGNNAEGNRLEHKFHVTVKSASGEETSATLTIVQIK